MRDNPVSIVDYLEGFALMMAVLIVVVVLPQWLWNSRRKIMKALGYVKADKQEPPSNVG